MTYITAPRRRRVLYVEDDRFSREYVMRSLKADKDYEVDTAMDVIQALARLARIHYDAIILDYHLPLIDPVQAERALRKARVPICYFTCDVQGAKETSQGVPVVQKVMTPGGEGGVPELERVLETIMAEPLPEDYDHTTRISVEELEAIRGSAPLPPTGAP